MQWLPVCVNFTLDSGRFILLVQMKKVISMNYSSNTSSWKPWRWVRLDLILMMTDIRVYFRLKLSLTSGLCLEWLIYFKNLFYQNSCKEATNIGGGQIRGPLLTFLLWKNALFYIFQVLPLVSKITPGYIHQFQPEPTDKIH